MKDFQLLFYVLTQFVGVASISIAVFIYTLHKKRALACFIGFNASFFAIQSGITLNAYIVQTNNPGIYLSLFSYYTDILGTALSGLFGMFLVNLLLGKEITPLKRNIFIGIFLFQLIGMLTVSWIPTPPATKYIILVSLILVIAYQILTLLLNYKHIADKVFKRALRIFALISLVFFPFIILEFFRADIPVLKDLDVLKILALPSFFLVFNLYLLIFALKYFNSPAFIENNKLTDHFLKTYGITDKEAEVIELLLAGLTYKQIAEQLYIANKTVDNHIQNIYKKLEVTSKLQLANLVRSREK